jgi:hypothetical protein
MPSFLRVQPFDALMNEHFVLFFFHFNYTELIEIHFVFYLFPIVTSYFLLFLLAKTLLCHMNSCVLICFNILVSFFFYLRKHFNFSSWLLPLSLIIIIENMQKEYRKSKNNNNKHENKEDDSWSVKIFSFYFPVIRLSLHSYAT